MCVRVDVKERRGKGEKEKKEKAKKRNVKSYMVKGVDMCVYAGMWCWWW